MNSPTKPPSRLIEGKSNPEYHKWYREKRKAEGNPLKQCRRTIEQSREYMAKRKAEGKPISGKRKPEYFKAYREKRIAEGRPLKSKEDIKRWNDSEKGKAARARYAASKKGREKRIETPDEYAERIIRQIEKRERYLTHRL